MDGPNFGQHHKEPARELVAFVEEINEFVERQLTDRLKCISRIETTLFNA